MRLGSCILVAAALMSAVAEADNNNEARKHFVNLKIAEARTLFDRGEMRPAIAILEATYAATKSPTVLFNLGGIHEYIGKQTGSEKELRIALDYFRRFVEAAPSAPERSEAERIIGELVLALKLDTKPPEEAAKPTPAPQEPVKTAPPPEPPKTIPPDETAKTSPPPGAPEKPAPRVETPKRRPPRTPPVAACPAPTPPPAPPVGQIASASPSIVLGNESYRDAGFKLHQYRALGRSQLGDHAGAIAEYLAAHDLIPKAEVLCAIAGETIKSCNKMSDDEDALIGCFESARGFYQRCFDSTPPAEKAAQAAPTPEIRNIDIKVSALQGQRDRKAKFRSRLLLGSGIGTGVVGVATLVGGIALRLYGNALAEQYDSLPRETRDSGGYLNRQSRSFSAWGDGLMATGALLALTSGVLLWRGHVATTTSRKGVWISAGAGGFMVTGRF